MSIPILDLMSWLYNHIINNDILIIERSKSFNINDIIVYMDDADIVIGKLSDSNKNIIGKVIGLYRKMWKNKGYPCFYICFPFTTLLFSSFKINTALPVEALILPSTTIL